MGVGGLIRLASRERERERELSSAPGQGDIILQPTKPKSRLKVVFFVLLGLVLVTGASLAVFLWINSNRNKSDGGATNRAVLELLNESHGDIVRIQSLMISAKTGRTQVCASLCFSDTMKANITGSLAKIQNFSDAMSEFDPRLITSEPMKERFITLRDAVKEDLVAYNDILWLYDLFFNYINNEYDEAYLDEILQYNDDRIVDILKYFDDLPTEDRYQHFGVIVQKIFNIALGDAYPRVYYYELMGEIEGGLEYEENKDV